MEKQIWDLQIQLATLKTIESSYATLEESLDEESYVKEEDTEAALNTCMSALTVNEEPWYS